MDGLPKKMEVTLFLILLYISFPSLCLCFSPDNHISEERALELFKQWTEKNDKVYKHEADMKHRFQTFRTNLRFVLEKNNMKIKSDSSSSSHVVGLNKFADISNEEFRQVYLSKVKKSTVLVSNKEKKILTCNNAPSTLDWRTKGVVTGVKDQGQCGSCWAFSSIGAIEAVNAIVTGELISLSEQELVDCDMMDDGCNGGFMDTAFQWVIGNGGINTESEYPYTGVDQSCKIAKEQVKVVSIDSYEDVSPDEESVLVCALLTQPITVGIDGGAHDFQLYTGGVYSGECSSNPDDINHAVLVVGYGSEGDEEYWIAKNSWGTSWGMEGYIYIKKNTSLEYGVCAINAMASYPTKEHVSPSPFPSPSAPPLPPPTPKPPSPPPPPSPTPRKCGKFHYCQPGTTCCCMFEFYDYCLMYGCCGYENAVCCEGTRYCCPQDYPICDVDEGLCYKLYGDSIGVAAKKRNIAEYRLPWTVYEKADNEYQPLQWKRNQVGVMR
ncbi:hypothetical protein ACHQM5_018440 [Ranunculus cassubicifolius]